MKFITLFSVALLSFATALAVRAQSTITTPITVPNGSFETYGYPYWTTTNTAIASGWLFDVQGGSQYGVDQISSNFSSEGTASGSSYAYINNDAPGVTDTITSAAPLATITADTTYTLTVAIGNISAADHGIYSQPGPIALSLLADGQAFATTAIPNGSVANGTFQDFSLTYTTPDSSSIIGDNLTVQLATEPMYNNAFVGAFDNVRLDETTIEAAPEPSTLMLVAVAGIGLVYLSNRRRLRFAGAYSAPVVAALSLAGLIAAGSQSASADIISVPNASFETSTSGGGSTYDDPDIISNWTIEAPSGDLYGQLWTVFFNSPGTSQGNESAFIDLKTPGEEADLTTASPLGSILADTTYTLTVAVGNADLNNPALETGPLVFDPIGDTPPAPVTLTLLAGGQPFATESIPAGTVPDGTFQDFSLTYTAGDSDPVIGQQLTIQLGTESDSGAEEAGVFDNVRLDATANEIISGGGDVDGSGNPGTAPEPPSYGLLGLGLAALGWLARWQRFQRDLLY